MSDYAGLEATTELVAQLKAITGDKEVLDTTDKSTLVAAINELYNSIFDVTVSGATWDALTDNLYHITKIIQVGNVLLGTNTGSISSSNTNYDGIWRSVDGGTTWAHTLAVANYFKLVYTSNRTIVAVCCGAYDASAKTGVWRSTDLGATWTQVTGIPGNHFYTISVLSDDTLITSSAGNGTYYSIDDGITWTLSNNAVHTKLVSVMNNRVFCADYPVMYSDDKGATWNITDYTEIYDVVITPNNSIIMSIKNNSAQYKLVRSTDNGTTWQTVVAVSASYALAVDVDGTVIATSKNDRLYVSLDDGITWSSTSAIGCTLIVSVDNTFIAADASRTSNIVYSTDKGSTWQQGDILATFRLLLSISNKAALALTDDSKLYISSYTAKPKWETAIEQLASQLNT